MKELDETLKINFNPANPKANIMCDAECNGMCDCKIHNA